jgi:hypothetical protein
MRGFSPKVRRAAYKRCDGRCELCGRALAAGDYHYDHAVPWALSGDRKASNCQVLCRACHGEKTARRDVPAIAKVKRIADRLRGARTATRLMGAGRYSRLRKTMAGAVVPRLSQAEQHREFISRRYGRADGDET